MHRSFLFFVLASIAVTLAACAEPRETPSTPEAAMPQPVPGSDADHDLEARNPATSALAGTTWELLTIQSMDDTTWTPTDPSRYTLTFEPSGDAYMQLDCNRGRAAWTSEGPRQLTFSPVASTSALCHDDGLSERYARQLEFVRTYTLRDGHLFLATFADGAILEFRPAE